MSSTYKIIRFYENHNLHSPTIKRCLTLEQAKEWCRSDEASSKTCSTGKFNRLGDESWFEGYTEE